MRLALDLAAAGFPVFPVNMFRQGNHWRKVPWIKNWERVATTDANLIKLWWDRWPLAMPGIPLGRCGYVVVDCDRHGGPDGVELFQALGPFPPHPIIKTWSDGQHRWFRQPAKPISLVKWDGGEVRGIGHFVVGYAVPKRPIPELPEVFWKQQPNTHLGVTLEPNDNTFSNGYRSNVTPRLCLGVGPPTEYETNYAKRSLANACYELRQCPEGQRNIKLNALAYKMGRLIVRGWIMRDQVELLLLRACEANGLIADDGLAQCRLTLASGINAGMEYPYRDIGDAA